MRLIDADKVTKPIYAEDDNISGCGMTYDEMDAYNNGIDALWSKIELAPTVDAVEVVRCRNCKQWEYRVGTSGICKRFSLKDHMNWVSDVDFCSYGERKEVSE